MAYIALAAAIVALVVAITAVLATAEAQISIETLRKFAGYTDEARVLPEVIAALYGQPVEESGLPRIVDGGILFVSTKCLSCHNLASGLHGALPEDLTVVLVASDTQAADAWRNRTGLSEVDVEVDIDGVIGERLGLNITPSYLAVRDGRIVDAKSLSSTRALMHELEEGPPVLGDPEVVEANLGKGNSNR